MLSPLITWRSLLDVVLIAAALFFLYRTLIRLGTWKIVSGMLIAAVVFFLASYLDLKGIEWIYRNVSHVAVISLVVIFQPELRKIFERTATMRRNKNMAYDDEFARLIAESLWDMASKRIGAIVVIPGDEPVKPWLDGGYPVDAVPSYPLIVSLFDPHSPGHDGALIVRRGKVSEFGVRLPVSKSGKLPEWYGTRHQAAMGLCERCDAMVLVSSEERGTVSVFYNGDISVMADKRMILDAICTQCKTDGSASHLDMPPVHTGRRIIVEGLGALMVSLVFWLTMIYSQSEIIEKIITVPIEYTATADNMVMIGEKPKDIRVHLTGSKSDLSPLAPSDLSVMIDLAKAAEGKHTFPINEDNIHLPKGLRLVDVDPVSIDITMAKLTLTAVTIEPQLVGKLPDGFELVSVQTLPESISALFPAGENEKTPGRVTTTPVFLNNIRETTTLFCKIVAPPSAQSLEKRWPDVSVVITVRPVSMPAPSTGEGLH
ncbi:hypothetical protein JCM14469_41800 [Desulfatiferula olefinivorans]